MKLALLVLPALAALAVALALTPVARWLSWRVGAIDQPSPRKVHAKPTARLGGLAVVAAVLLVGSALSLLDLPGLPKLPPELGRGAFLGLLPILIISALDDIRPLPSLPRFLCHLTGAGIAVSLGVRLGETIHVFDQEVSLGVLAIPLSILWIVGVTNAFNLIDGLDGLSAGLALISALSLAAVFFLSNRSEMAAVSLVLAGALVGFLPFNLFPASVFLGDAGATAIGFFLACLALRGGTALSAGFAVLLPVFILGVPLADSLISVLRRVLRRLSGASSGVFEADKDHIHHRLIALGLNQRRAVLVLYGAGLLLAAAGFLSLVSSRQSSALLLATLLAAGFIGISRLGYEEFAVIRRGVVLKIYDAPVLKRALFAVFVDLALTSFAVYAAIGLKFDDWGLAGHTALLRESLVLALPIALVSFQVLGLYRGAWRHASLDDLIRAFLAVSLVAATLLVAGSFVLRPAPPISFFLIFWLTLLLCVNGSRFSFRVLSYLNLRAAREGEPVLIYGAGLSGTMALREALANSAVGLRPVGFIDDDPEKKQKTVNGYPVLGALRDLEDLVRDLDVRALVVSTHKISPDNMAAAQQVCGRAGLRLIHFRIDFQPAGE